MKTGFAVRLAALAVVGAMGSAEVMAAVTYQYDDGQTDTAMGPPSSFNPSPVMGWGNYFVTDGTNNYLNNIQIAFGPTWPSRDSTGPNGGGAVTVYVFEDPDDDFDPRNATLLTQVTLVPETIGLSTFNDFPIPLTQVSGGFFVMATTYAQAGQDRPAAQDASAGAPTDRSWLLYNPSTVGPNLTDLSANALFGPAASYTVIDGVYMIRAQAVPEAGTLGMMMPAAAMLLRRRSRR